MSYYPPFTKLQDMGLELANKQPGSPLTFRTKGETATVQVYGHSRYGRKVVIWLGRQIVFTGALDSEYDFNTIWEGLIEPYLATV